MAIENGSDFLLKRWNRFRPYTGKSARTARAESRSDGQGEAASTPAGATMSTCRWAKPGKCGAFRWCRRSPASGHGNWRHRRSISAPTSWRRWHRDTRWKFVKRGIFPSHRRFS